MGQIHEFQVEFQFLDDFNHGIAILHPEAGAEHVVSTDDLVQTFLKRLDIHVTDHLDTTGDVVKRRAGFQLIENPEAFLCEG